MTELRVRNIRMISIILLINIIRIYIKPNPYISQFICTQLSGPHIGAIKRQSQLISFYQLKLKMLENPIRYVENKCLL